jgi:hypothetical protein
MRLAIVVVLAALLLMPLMLAEGVQPTQQFNKILLTPLYRESMASNTNYTYNVTVNPPDRVGSVKSAIVSFNAQINGQTQNFTLWVNGRSCVNPSYYIATAFSATGNTQVYFDCANVITRAGNYTVTVRSAVNTGVVSGWLDLTYMNDPAGSVLVHGTEYRTGERATVWLQLKDNQGLPVNNGACYLDVYAPSSANVSRPEIVAMAPMLYRNGSEGVYYYELVTPNITGVYMDIASCSYAESEAWVYSLDGTEVLYPVSTMTTGSCVGSNIFLVDYEDWIYTKCDAAAGGTKIIDMYYDFNTTLHLGNLSAQNITNMDLFYMGESSVNGVVLNFSVWNWTSGNWRLLSNSLTMSGTATSQPLGIGDFVSNSVPISRIGDVVNATNGIVRIRMYTQFGSSYTVYNNWLNFAVKTALGTIQDLKGSSEMHVNDWFSGLESNASLQLGILQQINATTNNTGRVVSQINVTTNNTGMVVAQINATTNNTASLVSQIWLWVQSIFNWTQTTAAADQKVLFVQGQYYQAQSSAVLVQVQRNGSAVTGASCTLNVYYPNMTVFVANGAMSYSGVDGMYNYTWTPVTYGSHIGQVNCSGGTLTGQVQTSGSLGVSAPSTGIIMQSVS